MTFRERDEVILVISHAKNCVYSQQGEAIPAIIALFLSHCIYMISTPESSMYPAFSKFLLQRPLLDQRDVPMFYLLFFTTSDEPQEDHKWLLKFLSEGLVRSQVSLLSSFTLSSWTLADDSPRRIGRFSVVDRHTSCSLASCSPIGKMWLCESWSYRRVAFLDKIILLCS